MRHATQQQLTDLAFGTTFDECLHDILYNDLGDGILLYCNILLDHLNLAFKDFLIQIVFSSMFPLNCFSCQWESADMALR